MYTPLLIGLDKRYGPYAHFGYWTLISDPEPNILFKNLIGNDQEVPKVIVPSERYCHKEYTCLIWKPDHFW